MADSFAGTGALVRLALRRDRLFFTDWGRTLEASARQNLERAARGD